MSQFEVIPSISVGDDTSDVDATTVTATPSEVQQQSSKSPPILKATCVCEQFCLELEGQPIRLSICHCLACQKRTGSTFGEQARFHPNQVKAKIGVSKEFVRIGDEGSRITYDFCPDCGTTICWRISGNDDLLAVAVGTLGLPRSIGTPSFSVYEDRMHPWVRLDHIEGMVHWN